MTPRELRPREASIRRREYAFPIDPVVPDGYNDAMELEFLGTGTSHGIPVIACSCCVCRSADPRDVRFRSSLLVRGAGGERILVDAGPEFRLQALRAGIERLDALLLTHAHADHLHGLDDVRPLTVLRPLPVYGNRPTMDELRRRFEYIFLSTQLGGGKPSLRTEVAEGPIRIGGIDATPVPVLHGELPILGWLFEEAGRRAAYLTDASSLPPGAVEALGSLDVLILGALRATPHATHFSFDQALELVRELAPRRAFLTHMCHEHSHTEIQDYLDRRKPPCPIAPAHDGLVVQL